MKKEHKEFAEIIKQKLIKQQSNRNTETAHSEADEYLCDLLVKLGFEDVVEEYTKLNRWFA